MSVLDASAYQSLGGPLWERANKALDALGRDITPEDIEAVVEASAPEEGKAGKLVEALETLIKRRGVPTSAAAVELTKEDAAQRERNRAVALETAELKLGRELEVLVQKSQDNYYLPIEYYRNEEAMAHKKKEILEMFERRKAEQIIADAIKRGLDANQQNG